MTLLQGRSGKRLEGHFIVHVLWKERNKKSFNDVK